MIIYEQVLTHPLLQHWRLSQEAVELDQIKSKMKYGKWLRDEIERTFPEWKGQFISYKKLKKQLKLINSRWPRFATTRFLEVNNMRLSIGFTRLLNNELNKINMFYFDKEEDYIIRLKVFCWSFLPGLLV